MNRREFFHTAALPLAAQAAQESGFTPLFDGRTLNGWSVQDGPESAFYADKGEIAASVASQFPAWLRYDRPLVNFDFRGEFFVRGWIDGGVYLHAPEHGRNMWCGMLLKIFHQQDKVPATNSMGAIFPVVAPLKVNVRNRGEWNTMRILMDWPKLRVWVNDEPVQDLDCDSNPDLRHRLRRGYLGLSGLGYPIRFRNLRLQELPAKEQWQVLYEAPGDYEKNWFVSESNERTPVRFTELGGVLRGEGLGHVATREKFRDFRLQCYIRHSEHHNGGVLFRTAGKGLSARHYEIQLHDVEESHYPTGSLYYFKRSIYPRIEAEKWWLMQVWAQGRNLLVRINGENVLEYDRLEDTGEGSVELQAHQAGSWTEYKHIQIQRL